MDPSMMMSMDFMNQGMPPAQPYGVQPVANFGGPQGQHARQENSPMFDEGTNNRIPTGPAKAQRGGYRSRGTSHGSSNRWQ